MPTTRHPPAFDQMLPAEPRDEGGETAYRHWDEVDFTNWLNHALTLASETQKKRRIQNFESMDYEVPNVHLMPPPKPKKAIKEETKSSFPAITAGETGVANIDTQDKSVKFEVDGNIVLAPPNKRISPPAMGVRAATSSATTAFRFPPVSPAKLPIESFPSANSANALAKDEPITKRYRQAWECARLRA